MDKFERLIDRLVKKSIKASKYAPEKHRRWFQSISAELASLSLELGYERTCREVDGNENE